MTASRNRKCWDRYATCAAAAEPKRAFGSDRAVPTVLRLPKGLFVRQKPELPVVDGSKLVPESPAGPDPGHARATLQ